MCKNISGGCWGLKFFFSFKILVVFFKLVKFNFVFYWMIFICFGFFYDRNLFVIIFK